MTVLVVTYRHPIVFLQNAPAPTPPQLVNHQPQVPQPAEPEDPLPPPQPLRRSQSKTGTAKIDIVINCFSIVIFFFFL